MNLDFRGEAALDGARTFAAGQGSRTGAESGSSQLAAARQVHDSTPADAPTPIATEPVNPLARAS